MLTVEYKVRGRPAQYAALDEAIRTVQFIRNTCLRLWMDGQQVTANDLQAHCAVLAGRYPFVARLNSQARQQAADRAWAAISRFYANCRAKIPGKKGYPRFQRHCRSVEYKVTGWKLDAGGGHLHLTFTDGHGIGRLRLVGTRSIETFPVAQIKRVRVVRRADGYYVQFCVQAERRITHPPTGKQLGIDVGLAAFVTDSEGGSAPNPRYLRQAETRLTRLHRRVSRKQNGSKNRQKARQRLARVYLHISRQREDHARKLAGALISSCDWIAYEDLQIRHMVKNRHLAKSISDASWARFLWWVAHYARASGIVAVAVPPRWTSQDCSMCGRRVQKSLSVRTHRCPHCGLELDRDHNAALNILRASVQTAQTAQISNRTAG